MGDPSLPAFSPAGVPGREATAPPINLSRSTPKEPSDNLALLGVLRQALAAGTQSTDSILQAIADAGRILSGAHGTALAVRVNGAVVCRARSGDTAPGLGTTLDSDSGISGECLRTATTMVCRDAAIDARVDAEACLSLGVRSIVAVPLRGRLGMLGILEAFSAWPGAFGEEQINSLRSLAEIAETACERERRAQTVAAVGKAPAKNLSTVLDAPSTAESGRVSEGTKGRPSRKLYWIVGIAAIALVLISTVVWISWRQTAKDIAANEPSSHPASAVEKSTTTAPPSAAPVRSEAPVVVRPSGSARTDPIRGKDLLRNAAEVHTVGDRPDSSTGVAENSPARNEPKKTILLPDPAKSVSEPPPSIEMSTSALPAEMLRSASESAPLPQLGARVSQGIIEAKLIHKVVPDYPAEARKQRLAGSVNLDATIGEDGAIKGLTLSSPASPLTDAAAAAVRQWRFSPAVLNGKAIEVQRRITVVFKLP